MEILKSKKLKNNWRNKMINLYINRELQFPKNGIPITAENFKNSVKNISYEMDYENEIDHIIYCLICAEEKRTGDGEINFVFDKFQMLSRLELAEQKLKNYIKTLRKETN